MFASCGMMLVQNDDKREAGEEKRTAGGAAGTRQARKNLSVSCVGRVDDGQESVTGRAKLQMKCWRRKGLTGERSSCCCCGRRRQREWRRGCVCELSWRPKWPFLLVAHTLVLAVVRQRNHSDVVLPVTRSKKALLWHAKDLSRMRGVRSCRLLRGAIIGSGGKRGERKILLAKVSCLTSRALTFFAAEQQILAPCRCTAHVVFVVVQLARSAFLLTSCTASPLDAEVNERRERRQQQDLHEQRVTHWISSSSSRLLRLHINRQSQSTQLHDSPDRRSLSACVSPEPRLVTGSARVAAGSEGDPHVLLIVSN